MQRLFQIALVATILLLTASPALAQDAPEVVHQERVIAGPYQLTVGFSDWPILADRSLDILFIPDGGIDRLSGSVTLIAPDGSVTEEPLVRHPRMRSVWGMDVIALPQAGPWILEFHINGPQGTGVGRMAPLLLGERPGPPLELSWLIAALPLLALIGLVVGAWLRVRPGQRAGAWDWQELR